MAKKQKFINRLPYASGPDCYALTVTESRFSPTVEDGDQIIINPAAPLEVGRLAVIVFPKGLPLLVKLDMVPPSGVKVPTGGNAMPCLGIVLNDEDGRPGCYQIPVDKIESCHRVVGVARDEKGCE